eukprot:TRINITY_DN6635_c0_g4_i2.p1 TRINITY_DN6635_c0_g4~~TRINITY_DN6635_c0_g4_i2.p1  ORF type:complete len:256 (+),score=83.20 TRINITY_DN6635_c0_g4_i2:61-828(+)
MAVRAPFLAAVLCGAGLLAPPCAAGDAQGSVYLVDIAGAAAPAPGLRRVHSMKLRNGSQYTCYLPHDAPPGRGGGGPAPMAAEDLTAAAAPRIDAFFGGKCVVKHTGWWSYEYCHGKVLRQYHEEGVSGVVSASYPLGWRNVTSAARYRPATAATEDGALPAVSSDEYVGGADCDLTGAPRRVTVVYFCHPMALRRTRDHSALTADPASTSLYFTVEETSTCEYLASLHVPSLCPLTHPEDDEPTHELLTCHVSE